MPLNLNGLLTAVTRKEGKSALNCLIGSAFLRAHLPQSDKYRLTLEIPRIIQNRCLVCINV